MYLCVKGRSGFWLDGVNELVSKGGSDELGSVCTCLAEGLVVGGLFLSSYFNHFSPHPKCGVLVFLAHRQLHTHLLHYRALSFTHTQTYTHTHTHTYTGKAVHPIHCSCESGCKNARKLDYI